MRVAALEAFGVDEQLVDVWKESGHERLLPVQELAVRKYDALNGHNVLVFSPTSSGKTFVGEMAAAKKARTNQRVFYLVPQKALAEEKYREFRAKYSPLGIRTVISTRDRKESDRDIKAGRFHIAVVVFEKMQGLLVSKPALLNKVGLVVVDELQMIGDRTRGAGLEILLTKVRMSRSRPQVIGLSAVLGKSEAMARWLGADLCQARRRPVELRMGVLHEGGFRYVEHNSGNEGREELARVEEETEIEEALVTQVAAFAAAGEQSLVFCKTKKECVHTAFEVARRLEARPAAKALKELQGMEDSHGNDVLARLLARRVAYHNAALDWDQRDLVERHFRENEILVLCATSTLAMGINLPAKNVFIDPNRWYLDRFRNWGTRPISQGEYENMGGRAGRLGLEDEFGRSIIVESSQFQAKVCYDVFARGDLGDVEPTLEEDQLGRHVLNLVASRMCRTEKEVRQVLLSSFTGETRWRGNGRQGAFEEKLSRGLRKCLGGALMWKDRYGDLKPTRLGQVAASKGVTIDTAVRLVDFARKHAFDAAGARLLEVLLCLTGTEDGQQAYFNLSTVEYDSGRYLQLLKEMVQEFPPGAKARLSKVLKLHSLSYEKTQQAKKAMILHDWVTGVSTRDIESRFQCYSGSIVNLGQEVSWLADALSEIAEVCDWPEIEVERMRALSRQLICGVTRDGLDVARARVKGLARARIASLVTNELDTLRKVAEAPREVIEKLVTKPVAARLLRRVRSILEREQAREPGQDEQAEAKAPTDAAEAQEEEEWEKGFPPADITGAAYLSDARVHFDGRQQGRRYLILIDGKDAWAREKSFETALRLAVAAKTVDLGWCSAANLGGHDSYHQHIRRLKHDLSPTGANVEALIENNWAKQYRFSVPRANISIDVPAVRRCLPDCEELLPTERH